MKWASENSCLTSKRHKILHIEVYTQQLTDKSLNTCVMILIEVLGAFDNSKGMTNHSYKLSFVSKANANSVVTTLKINLREYCGTCHHIQHVVKPWNRKLIFDFNFIDHPAIHTHSP